VEAEFDSSVTSATGQVIAGIREGNRLPTVPELQLSANASYTWQARPGAEAFVSASVQHVGSRFTQPSDQENTPRTFVHGLPFGGAPASASTTVDLELPEYQLVNLSAGLDFNNGFGVQVYANNIFDENPLLSFDRERGGRARLGFNIGQPRQIGVTVRKRF
jgi:iron complex outermembrane receptor protein